MTLSLYIFDMDGVLLDSMPLWTHLGEDFLRKCGQTPPPDLEEHLLVMSMTQAAEYFRKNFGISWSIPEIIQRMNDLGAGFYEREAPLRDGIQPVLEAITRRGHRCVVATATDRPLVLSALRRTGIEKYFGRIYTCTEEGVGKDHPEFFQKVLDHEGLKPQEAIVVEDALHAIRSAKAAGISTLGIFEETSRKNWPAIQQEATKTIRAWQEFILDEPTK